MIARLAPLLSLCCFIRGFIALLLRAFRDACVLWVITIATTHEKVIMMMYSCSLCYLQLSAPNKLLKSHFLYCLFKIRKLQLPVRVS